MPEKQVLGKQLFDDVCKTVGNGMLVAKSTSKPIEKQQRPLARTILATGTESNKLSMKKPATGKFLKILPILLILLYFSLAVIKIRYPGIQYDEILFGNAALGGIDWTFIIYKIGDLPVLLMPYIGAVKAYIYYPIFKLFGVSPLSIRIPTILMTAGSLYLLFNATKKYFDDKIALLALFIIATDASFISLTRVDVGPTVIEFCCKVLTLYLLLKLLDNLKHTYLLAIYAVLAVGLFNKLNFIWFVNSLIFSVIVVFGKEFQKILYGKSVKQKILFASLNILGCAGLFGYYLFIARVFNLTKPLTSPFTATRLTELHEMLKNLITGESFYAYALGDIHTKVNDYYFLFSLMLLISGFFLVFFRKQLSENEQRRNYYFFLSIFLTTMFQISITEQASAPWHIFSVYPFISILLGVSLVIILRALRPKSVMRSMTVYGVLTVIALYCVSMNVRHVQSYDKPTKSIIWSKAIYELIEYTKKSPYRFVSVDWGTQTQLLTFDPVEGKYFEICYGLRYGINAETPEDEIRVAAAMLEPANDFAFIMHPLSDTSFSAARGTRFEIFDVAERFGKRLRLIKTISDGGKDIFEIYLPERKSQFRGASQ